ncbi:hypothetical protein EVAR_78130_1 [Eumeta japonica]|uniref:Uncharacterized protein n=1 Tax=Eumeta variegata TaxID=151549 RepID=A0A4C1T3H8_EUMVA|nr:hypothetical protein EVAR_78130_1 [Eumeta japonica]
MLPLMDYGVQLLSRCSATNLSKIERQYRMALKSAAKVPKKISTEALWEIADIEAWLLKKDSNQKMLYNIAQLEIEDLESPIDAYLVHE